MNAVATTAGSPWGISAISNAEWEGARLVDVLRAAGAGSRAQAEFFGLSLLLFYEVTYWISCRR
jgi:Oxidoreductase molybdopterin binding domain